MSHTPTPWKLETAPSGQLCIVSDQAWICGQLSNGNGEEPGEGEANAAFIVKACNEYADLKRKADAHDELVKALERIAKYAVYVETDVRDDLRHDLQTIEHMALTALAKAEGRTE